MLTVLSGSAPIASNAGWGINQTAVTIADTAVFAFPLTDPQSLDSALVTSLASSSGYTVQVASKGGNTGNALAEVYDDTLLGTYGTTTPRLINLSCKQQVLAGGLLTAGFTLGGITSKTVLIRATGPALSAFGVSAPMPDPSLVVFSGQSVLASNSAWGGDPNVTSAAAAVGAFALNDPTSLDSAVLMTLAPGSYTVQAKSVSGSAGVVLIEIYEIP
jgi:hypothetical protein